MDTRHNQLVLLSKKVESANDKINEILSRLGWTRTELTQWQTKKQDSTSPNKRSSAKTATSRKQAPLSSLFFYKDSSSVISFIEPSVSDSSSTKHITDDIHQINQHQHDKCQAYDQIIHRSNQLRQLYHHHHPMHKQTSQLDDIVHQDQRSKRKRQQQESNQHQDKRKRAKYRVKMNKMNTPIEVQRDLIHAYMQAFNKQL